MENNALKGLPAYDVEIDGDGFRYLTEQDDTAEIEVIRDRFRISWHEKTTPTEGQHIITTTRRRVMIDTYHRGEWKGHKKVLAWADIPEAFGGRA